MGDTRGPKGCLLGQAASPESGIVHIIVRKTDQPNFFADLLIAGGCPTPFMGGRLERAVLARRLDHSARYGPILLQAQLSRQGGEPGLERASPACSRKSPRTLGKNPHVGQADRLAGPVFRLKVDGYPFRSV